eukprot:TRINITY_DN12748_c0_g1_i2.p1 TRINITY_DN12748_c0_g1~~TRINITY_DN12748_c0_g1_i2.p1  ORF type:complete len:254 (+),score=70.88 TRINITY_DN12748_c0_g1_i2:55-762(+)
MAAAAPLPAPDLAPATAPMHEAAPATAWLHCPLARQRLEQRLRARIPDVEHVEIDSADVLAEGDAPSQCGGAHLRIEVVSPAFEGMRPVDRQRLVHSALSEELASGALHSLPELLTLTPAQRQRRAATARLGWVGDRIRAAVPGVQHLEIKDVTNGHAIEGFYDGSNRALDPNGLELELLVVSDAFLDLKPLARQRLVQEALGPEVISGKIHALPRMKTKTPAQWLAEQGQSVPA